MPDEEKKNTSDKNFASSGAWIAIGSGMGVALGTAFGAAADNIGMGVAFGIVFGTAAGAIVTAMNSRSNSED
jgi:hypothetical protein